MYHHRMLSLIQQAVDAKYLKSSINIGEMRKLITKHQSLKFGKDYGHQIFAE